MGICDLAYCQSRRNIRVGLSKFEISPRRRIDSRSILSSRGSWDGLVISNCVQVLGYLLEHTKEVSPPVREKARQPILEKHRGNYASSARCTACHITHYIQYYTENAVRCCKTLEKYNGARRQVSRIHWKGADMAREMYVRTREEKKGKVHWQLHMHAKAEDGEEGRGEGGRREWGKTRKAGARRGHTIAAPNWVVLNRRTINIPAAT